MKKVAFLTVSMLGLSLTILSKKEFFYSKIWSQIILKRLPRIFLWSSVSLFAATMINQSLHIEDLFQSNSIYMIFFAAIVGLIPTSGPHLIFVSLFSKGFIGFAPLLVSAIVQDGHGMIPVLSQSRKLFFVIKLINVIFGLIVGVFAAFVLSYF